MVVGVGPDRLAIATKAAQRASQRALALWSDRQLLAIEFKGDRDFVSQADRVIEQQLRETILEHCPRDVFVGEELGGTEGAAFWSLDPIDGTANFLRGSPLWGISIAYVIDGSTTVSVIALPAFQLFITASSTDVARCNGKAIEGRNSSPIKQVAVGDNSFWHAAAIGELERRFRDAGHGVAGYRCATVGLGFAALGFIDGYFEKWTNEWDVAAGRLLCEKAGLTVVTGTQDAKHAAKTWIKAGTPELHAVANPVWAQL